MLALNTLILFSLTIDTLNYIIYIMVDSGQSEDSENKDSPSKFLS